MLYLAFLHLPFPFFVVQLCDRRKLIGISEELARQESLSIMRSPDAVRRGRGVFPEDALVMLNIGTQEAVMWMKEWYGGALADIAANLFIMKERFLVY